MITPPLLADPAVVSAGDTAWVLTSTALVMVMTVGLAFFYGGLVRPKNALNTMMMSVVALGVVGVQWVLAGYSLAFAHGSSWIGGLGWMGLRGVGLVEPQVRAHRVSGVVNGRIQTTKPQDENRTTLSGQRPVDPRHQHSFDEREERPPL